MVFLLALAYFYSTPYNEWRQEMSKPENVLASLPVESINRIMIAGGDRDIVLEKVDERWRIEGTKDFYLKEETASSLRAGLEELIASDVEIVSENPDKKADFETSEDTGIKVTLMEGENELAEFMVGKMTNDLSGTYLALVREDKTYVFKTSLRNVLAGQSWYDMDIFDDDAQKITKIRFQYPNREFSVEKNEETWSGTSPYVFRVDDEKIESIANIMAQLTATEIPEQSFENTGLEEHDVIVQATGEGIDNVLMIGNSLENEEEDSELLYYAKKGDSDNIYLIKESEKEELEKQIWELR